MGVYDKLANLEEQHSPTPPENASNQAAGTVPSAKPQKQPPAKKKTTPPKSKKSFKQERKIENKKVSNEESLQESKEEMLLDFIRPYLALKAAHTVSFRYPAELLERLEEMQYKMKKQYGMKVTKNAILVAALAHIIWDFEQHGEASFLCRQLRDRRK